MNYIKSTLLFLLLFYSIKILITLINKEFEIIDKKIQLSKSNNSLLSIKDLKKENYLCFINTIKDYLSLNNYKNVSVLEGGTPTLTNIKASTQNDTVFISCIQNDKLDSSSTIDEHLKPTSRTEVQCFIGRMCLNNCQKGIIINNSTFSKEAIKYIDSINSTNKSIHITLINGYLLTKAIRTKNRRYINDF